VQEGGIPPLRQVRLLHERSQVEGIGQTESKIKNLLPEGSVDDSTRLVLVNAVYFNAAWRNPVDPNTTYDGSFNLLDGSTVPVKMMGTHLSSALATKGTDFTAVALPYADERLSLLVVLPNPGAFTSFETALDVAKLDGIVASLSSQQVIVGLPRFKLETGDSLVELLQGLGMVSAFQPGVADFSGMDGSKNPYVSEVLHKAFIDVAEKGTEAAAATAVGMAGSAAPQGLEIFANRPFLYFLRDQPTGAILFMGRVLDPSKS
jgi:serpin B